MRKKSFVFVMTTLFVCFVWIAVQMVAKAETKSTKPESYTYIAPPERTDPALDGEFAKLEKFLGPKWEVEKDVFCATPNPISCDDQLEFSLDQKYFSQVEFDKIVIIWKEYGRGRRLEEFKHPDYKLSSIALLFAFPREKGIPVDLDVVYYNDGKKGSRYEFVYIYNNNLKWFTTIVTNEDMGHSVPLFEYQNSIKEIVKEAK